MAVLLEKSLLKDMQYMCLNALRVGYCALAHVLQTRFLLKGTRQVKDTGKLLL